MAGVVIEAPPKLNLTLDVGPRAADGFHPIRSLMVTVKGLADTVTVSPAPDREVVCPGVAERKNLAWRVLDRLERRVGHTLPCRVEITKRIPSEAGLGGGSSDAAATLVAANQLFGLGLEPPDLEEVGAEVGSDVPFFVRGGAQLAEGRGTRLSPAVAPPFAALIVVPGFGLPTARVYAAFDASPGSRELDPTAPPARIDAPLSSWVTNDLWSGARAVDPRLDEVATRLTGAGAIHTVLCGSGSAVAGFFDDASAVGAAMAVLPAGRTADRLVAAVVGPGVPRTFAT